VSEHTVKPTSNRWQLSWRARLHSWDSLAASALADKMPAGGFRDLLSLTTRVEELWVKRRSPCLSGLLVARFKDQPQIDWWQVFLQSEGQLNLRSETTTLWLWITLYIVSLVRVCASPPQQGKHANRPYAAFLVTSGMNGPLLRTDPQIRRFFAPTVTVHCFQQRSGYAHG
jgi:hypothetical protein